MFHSSKRVKNLVKDRKKIVLITRNLKTYSGKGKKAQNVLPYK